MINTDIKVSWKTSQPNLKLKILDLRQGFAGVMPDTNQILLRTNTGYLYTDTFIHVVECSSADNPIVIPLPSDAIITLEL